MHSSLLQKFELYFAMFLSGKLGGALGYDLDDVYLQNEQHFNGILILNCILFAGSAALIVKVITVLICWNTWLLGALITPGNEELCKGKYTFEWTIFCTRLSCILQVFWLGNMHKTFACLLQELYLENGRYCKGKLMFAFKPFAEAWAIFCKDFTQETSRKICLSFAWIIPAKWTILKRQINVCMQVLRRSLSYVLQGF